METNTENQILEQPEHTPIMLSDETQTYLRETRQWANFLAIVGFVFVGLIAVIALFAGAIFSSLGRDIPYFPSTFVGVFYLLMALLYFFPVLYLYRFSSFMRKALMAGNSEDMNAAFKNLKAHYRYIGILMIIMLSFYAIALLAGLLFGLASAFGN